MDRQVLLAHLLRRDHGFPSGAGADRPIMRGVMLIFLIMRNLTNLFRCPASAEPRIR
jgi:hypothetical protein